MTKVLYTAHARVTGGRVNGHGRSRDGQLEVDLRVPEEMGGPGGGTNPEELFAVGYAACFEGALATVARRRRLDAGDATIDSAVSLFPTGDGAFENRRHARRGTAIGRRPRDGRRTHPRSPPGVPLLQRHPRQRRRRPSSQR
jgi:Ohr subfamily peroxiredoxin